MTCSNPAPNWVEMMIPQQTHQRPAVHTPVPKSAKAALSQMVVSLKQHYTEWATAKVKEEGPWTDVSTVTLLYKADEVGPLVACALKDWIHSLTHPSKGIMQPKSKPVGQETPGLQPMADKKKIAYTAHARGHLLILPLRLSFRVRLTVWSKFPLQTSSPPPPLMPGVRPDWQCSGEHLSA